MRPRKAATYEYTTITVPCPECGCGCDVNLEDSDEEEIASISSDSETEVQPAHKKPRLTLDISGSEFESKPILTQSSTIAPPSSDPPPYDPDSDSDDDIPPWPTTYPKPEPLSQFPKPEPVSPMLGRLASPTPERPVSPTLGRPTSPRPRSLKPEPLTQTNIHQFFSQHTSFKYDPSQPVMSEFYRMIHSEDFPKASQAQAKREIEDALTKDFNLIYGTDVGDLEAWQGLCRVLGFENIPDDLVDCKKLVAATFVNIIDLIDTKISGKPVHHFKSEKELSKYTKKHKKFFPRDNVHSGGLLKFLLRRIHKPTAAKRDNPKPRCGMAGRRS
ncbi:hypothetical protein OPQ81_006228 [Rhizoctonia solani]|nr:hypothetical protein OPQ81_006228 [Rhizoctonia solani]